MRHARKIFALIISLGILLVSVLVCLKIFGVIEWSWILILMPVWIPVLVILALLWVAIYKVNKGSWMLNERMMESIHREAQKKK